MEIAAAIGRVARDAIGCQVDQTVRSFRIVRRAGFNPKHYCRMFKKSAVFVVAMAEGGLCVPSSSGKEQSKAPEIYSMIQVDGDILTKVASKTLSRPPEKQAAIVERHFQDVEAALSPMKDLLALINLSWSLSLALPTTCAAWVKAADKAGCWHLLTIGLTVISLTMPFILRYCMRWWWERQLQKFLKKSRDYGSQASMNGEGGNPSPEVA